MRHTRATDTDMTLPRRFSLWWREYGATITSLLALGVSGLIWFLSQSGFAVITPRDAVAEIQRTVTQKVDSVGRRVDAYQDSARVDRALLHHAVDSLKLDNTYTLKAIEAGNRVICFRDRSAAEVAGILCPSGKVPR